LSGSPPHDNMPSAIRVVTHTMLRTTLPVTLEPGRPRIIKVQTQSKTLRGPSKGGRCKHIRDLPSLTSARHNGAESPGSGPPDHWYRQQHVFCALPDVGEGYIKDARNTPRTLINRISAPFIEGDRECWYRPRSKGVDQLKFSLISRTCGLEWSS
jgi:hypothetical protein